MVCLCDGGEGAFGDNVSLHLLPTTTVLSFHPMLQVAVGLVFSPSSGGVVPYEATDLASAGGGVFEVSLHHCLLMQLSVRPLGRGIS